MAVFCVCLCSHVCVCCFVMMGIDPQALKIWGEFPSTGLDPSFVLVFIFGLSTRSHRLARHLELLDPYEVCEICLFTLWDRSQVSQTHLEEWSWTSDLLASTPIYFMNVLLYALYQQASLEVIVFSEQGEYVCGPLKLLRVCGWVGMTGARGVWEDVEGGKGRRKGKEEM